MPTPGSLQQKAGFSAMTRFRPGGQGENGAHKNRFSLVLIQEHGMILHIPISTPAPSPLIPGGSLTDHETTH